MLKPIIIVNYVHKYHMKLVCNIFFNFSYDEIMMFPSAKTYTRSGKIRLSVSGLPVLNEPAIFILGDKVTVIEDNQSFTLDEDPLWLYDIHRWTIIGDNLRELYDLPYTPIEQLKSFQEKFNCPVGTELRKILNKYCLFENDTFIGYV